MIKRIRKTGLSLPDIFAFGFLLAVFVAVVSVGNYWTGPMNPPPPVDLSLRSLPYTTFLSLSRIILAYIVCLISSLAIGYWAAHSKFAEAIIVPLIDIGQSVPVLGFLPGFVLVFISIFPDSRTGLEIAAVLTLYTGMAWNLMLSFYGSIKTIPREYVEIIRAYGYGRIGILMRLELPYSMNGIIWNSMLSVAGGWFFLTVCESYTIGDKSFQLVGLGSFMTLAAERHDTPALIAGACVMLSILLAADHFVWNPLLRWAERFQRMQPLSDEEDEQEPVLNFFTKSQRITALIRKFRRKYAVRLYVTQRRGRRKKDIGPAWYKIGYGFFALCILFCGWGLYQASVMLINIPGSEWVRIFKYMLYTLIRVNAVLVICTIICIPLGLWLGAKPRLVKKLLPVIQVFAAFPWPMVFPLILGIMIYLQIPLSFGGIIFMMTGSMWYLLFNVISGAAGVPANLVEVAKTSGMGTVDIIRRVYLPASFPQILTGLMTAAGGAWNTSIVAEVGSYQGQQYYAEGLGYYISKVASAGQWPQLIAAVTIMVLVIVLINRFFWARLYNLAESKYRLDG